MTSHSFKISTSFRALKLSSSGSSNRTEKELFSHAHQSIERIEETLENYSKSKLAVLDTFSDILGTLLELKGYLKSAVDLKNVKWDEVLVRSLAEEVITFDAWLDQLCKADKLERTLTHQRLRIHVEKKLISIEIKKQEIFKSTPLSQEELTNLKNRIDSAITDEDAKKLWKSTFGSTQYVPWQKFGNGLIDQIAEDELIVLKYLLDPADCDYVSVWKYSEFVKGFGPCSPKFRTCITNMRAIFRERWFCSFLSRSEAEGLLHKCPTGTFLFRFSRNMGNFAYAFVGQDRVYHVSIIGGWGTFKIKESKAKGEQEFKSLLEIINAYRASLIQPISSDLHLQSWFHGDLTSDETNELLSPNGKGAFLLRFSSSQVGAVAVSYVDDGKVKHLLLSRSKEGRWVSSGSSGNNVGYPTLNEFIKEGTNSNLLVKSLPNPIERIAPIVVQWYDSSKQHVNVVNSIWKSFMD